MPFSGCWSSNPKFWTDAFSAPHRASPSPRFRHASGKCCVHSSHSLLLRDHAWRSDQPLVALEILHHICACSHAVLVNLLTTSKKFCMLSWSLWEGKPCSSTLVISSVRVSCYRMKRFIFITYLHCRIKTPDIGSISFLVWSYSLLD